MPWTTPSLAASLAVERSPYTSRHLGVLDVLEDSSRPLKYAIYANFATLTNCLATFLTPFTARS